jgi:hypothetical protein
MAPLTKTLAAPGKPSPPHQVGLVSLGSLHCVLSLQKDWSFLLPNSPRKVHFWMHDWCVAFCWLCRFPFKQVQQWPSVPTARIASCVSTNDCVNCKKTDHFCSQFCQEKSILESMIGTRRFVGCRFPFKQVQWWPSMPMARIACCSITNEFLLETVLLYLWRWFTRASSCSTTVLSLCWRQQHISWLLWHNVSHIC